jgi:hypothetical protein
VRVWSGVGRAGFRVIYVLWAEERHVLHVMSFWEKFCFSDVGISARDARVAVEVVYHHIFFVFGQRSVYGVCIFNQTRVFESHTSYL